MSKKIITIILLICMITVSPLGAFAAPTDLVEQYTDTDLGFALERTIDGDKVTVVVREGSEEHIAINDNGTLYLDGELLSEDITNIIDEATNEFSINNSSAKWGKWQTSSQTLKTGGLGTTVIAGLIATFCMWVPAKAAATVAAAVAGKYDQITIKWKTRYKKEGKYLYYQRETTFHAGGKQIYGPVKDSGVTDTTGTHSLPGVMSL